MILNSNASKDLVVLDVYDCYVKDASGNILAMQRMQKVDLAMSANSSEIRAGKGNGLIMTLQDSKKLQVTLEQPTFSYELLCMQLGQNIAVASTGAKYIAETGVVTGGKINLKYTPVTGSVKVYDEDGKEITTTTVAEKVVTVTGVTDGEKVKVVYKTAFSANAQCIEINSKTFPKAVSLQMITEVYNSDEEHVGDLIIDIPTAKPSSEFNLGKGSTREGMTQTLVLDCLADTSGKIGYIYIDEPSK